VDFRSSLNTVGQVMGQWSIHILSRFPGFWYRGFI